MSPRRFRFGLRGFAVFCIVLAVVGGFGGRWWLRQFLPTVTIRDAAGAEGDPLTFSIVLSETSKARVAVRFATGNGAANAGQDYVAVPPTTVIFEPGEMQKTVNVETKSDDNEAEGDETMFVEVLGAAGAVVEKQRGIGKIIDGLAPADVAITRFYGDGKDLKIDYMVKGELNGSLNVLVFVSYNGIDGGPDLASGVGGFSRGKHTVALRPVFDDFQRDYTLMAMVDSDYGVDETNEENNFALFKGGAFLVQEPASGKKVLHIHGLDRRDSTPDFTPQSVDEVHFRGRGGEDHFDLDQFLPGVVGWLFGGEGNDTLGGSSAGDVIFGGPGTDTLHGGDQRDLLAGGDGRDKLYGGAGQDELFGGPENDMLFDLDGNTRFDGGPGQDLFNDSRLNPSANSLVTTIGDCYRDADDERELRIDLASGFADIVNASPEREWSVECKGAAIAGWSVKGDILHVEFNSGVPDVSRVNIGVAPRAGEVARSSTIDNRKQLACSIYSIAITGYKVERRTGTGDWIEERGLLWSSDALRWTPLYEPAHLPITWDVKWLSKPSEDLDHPRVEWQVFATGTKPIGNPGLGAARIIPQFVFGERKAVETGPPSAP